MSATVSPGLVVQPSAWWGVGHLAQLLGRHGVRDPEAEARVALRAWLEASDWPAAVIHVSTAPDSEEQLTPSSEAPSGGSGKGGTQTWDPPRRTIPAGWSRVPLHHPRWCEKADAIAMGPPLSPAHTPSAVSFLRWGSIDATRRS